MWMSLIAATLWEKKTATCRNFVHIFIFWSNTLNLSTLCSNVVAMWSRIDQGPGIHFVTSAVLKKKGATSVRGIQYFQHV